MSGYKVKYTDFDPSRVIFGKIDKKETKDAMGKPINYYIIDIKYMYDVKGPDGRVTQAKGDLFIEGPKETSRRLAPRTDEKNKTTHSIFTRYDLSNPEHVRFVMRSPTNPGTIHQLCMKVSDFVFNNGEEVGINDCTDENDMMKKLHYPLKWQMLKGVPVPGENPGAFWKMFRYGKDVIKQTNFYCPSESGTAELLTWDELNNCQFTHRPIFKVNNVTIAGSKPTIKIDLYSSVVYQMMGGGGPNLQMDTINEAMREDPGEIAKLQQQLRELRASVNAMNANAKPASPSPTPSDTNDDISIAGIVQQTSTMTVKETVPPPVNLTNVINSGVGEMLPTMIDIPKAAPAQNTIQLPGLQLPGLPGLGLPGL